VIAISKASYKEIAKPRTCPIGTVMSRLARARAKLALKLDQGLVHGKPT